MNRASKMSESLLFGALLLGISLLPFALPANARAVNVPVVSDAADKFWTVLDANGTPQGPPPQNVCANGTKPPLSPPSCPTEAMSYGWSSFQIWKADLGSPARAKWIWASDINGDTPHPGGARFSFEHPFYTCGTPTGGAISVAADDTFQVFINDSATPLVFTPPPNGSDVLSTATVSASSLIQGLNKVRITVTNADFPCATYKCNPAGVAVIASFADALSAWPKCTGLDGTTLYKPGERETSNCRTRTCGCTGKDDVVIAFWSDWQYTCTAPPPACTDYNYSDWSPCTSRQQSRTVLGSTPEGCKGTPSTQPVLTRTCQETCTSFTYSSWGECRSDNTMSRTVLTSSPAGCTGGTPETTKTSFVGVGDVCWDYNLGGIGCCPSGTECKSRRTPYEDCWFFGLFCSTKYLVSTDSFCDPK